MPDVNVFFIPAHMIVSLWAAAGTQAVLTLLSQVSRTRVPVPGGIILIAVLLLSIGYTWGKNYQKVDRSGDYSARRQIDALAGAPDGAVIYSSWSAGTAIAYLRFVEGRCRTCEILSLEGRPLEPLLDRDLQARRPIYVTSSWAADRLRTGYTVRQMGPSLWRIELAAGRTP